MSPLNRGPLMGPRIPPAAMRPPMPRFGRVPPPPPPGMARPMPPPPINPMFGIRGRPIPPPPPPPPPPRPGPMMGRPGVPVCPPMFPRGRPLPPMPPMGLRGPMVPRGPMMRPGPRGILPPHVLPHMRPRFPPNHLNGKGKMNAKKANKLEELELKKPWMTDEIRSEIQKKNKLYAKAKKNKDAKEWEEFKDLRNKVTRMIRDAKNEYLAKNPEQAHLYENDDAIEEANDGHDEINELSTDSEEESSNLYCEVCDRDFDSKELLQKHIEEHQTCNIDSCTFTAHPKIVEKHISMQHYTGLYHKMKNLSSEEDIKKWKAERKRLYPTSVNIQIKQATHLEKKKRGEVIENQSNRAHGTFKKENLRKNRKRKRNKLFKNNNCQTIEDGTVYRNLRAFTGTAILIYRFRMLMLLFILIGVLATADENDCQPTEFKETEALVECKIEISDEETQASEQSTKIHVPSKIFSLVADYGSNSDNDEPPDEVSTKLLKLEDNEIDELSQSQIVSSTVKENHKENVAQAVNLPTTTNNRKTKVNKSIKRNNEKAIRTNGQEISKNNKSNRLQKSKHFEISSGRLTLLKKLLARSIQYERNVIFQCIKFIANNNFFD
ncbi:PREDICTED: nuclear fragile X mental retardation-interacting protein 1-like [Ceratosolen solmsi marchali]|uniref:Nuclear fragile X mental retardation-interacting protein 1-like n=1 Tax=Ceratosolen solmsi marchali TaxID=326594 RepID=A0AAJ6YFM6_9HYME|nr:PREDICTED: nuclear fragile X mental retardation-interacting protein 1-like [Ceratosolen solmsi marchali]